MKHEFHYVHSSDINVQIQLRIVSLFGYYRYDKLSGEMFVKIGLYCNRRRIGCEVCTAYKPAASSGPSTSHNQEFQKWDQWLLLPITFAELSEDATLHFTLWDIGTGDSAGAVCIAQCTKKLFSKRGLLREGQMDLRLKLCGQDEIPAPCFDEPSTISKLPRTPSIDELLKKEKMYKHNYIEKVPWLDPITFARLEELKDEARTEDRSLYLSVEMPQFCEDDILSEPQNYRVLFHATEVPEAPGCPITTADPELAFDNLCELKHHMLTRNARSMNIDRRLQPNAYFKDMLEKIIKKPSCQPMTMEERDLVWKFRYWLRSNPHALTKFIRSVNWEVATEVRQAIQIICDWTPIDAADALELLGPAFRHPFVRYYAVSRLLTTAASSLLLYLPQLVQSLRYENQTNPNEESIVGDLGDMSGSTLEERAGSEESADASVEALMRKFFGDTPMDMERFLLKASCENTTIANFLFWYLKVEVEATAETDPVMSKYYSQLMERLKVELSRGPTAARNCFQAINGQVKFVNTLVNVAKSAHEHSKYRQKKLQYVMKKLAETPELMDLKGLPLPLDPSVHVCAVQPESTFVFSSKLMPMRLTFSTVRGHSPAFEYSEPYMTIFKRGDDLRQDQLVLQMIRLMDSLLKEEKLDLCLTPYSVLATGITDGFVQFVRASPLAELKQSIQETLRIYRPSATGPYGIEPDVLENYIRSCAGYSIICYVLGIGDRHLHNLLLREDGRMFHVDFGFILGRDPKMLPPPMKLTNEMLNGMGGQSSGEFRRFIDYCTTAFQIIRRHANLILNLFSLMLDAGIPDIAIEKDKAVQTILERLRLELSDEDAFEEINRVIQSSISAKIPMITDFVHDVKQYIVN